MAEDESSDLSYLWDGSAPWWVLQRLSGDSYAIVDQKNGMALILEDEEEHRIVIGNMLRAGVQIL